MHQLLRDRTKGQIPRELYTIRPQIWLLDLVLNWLVIVSMFFLAHQANTWLVFPFCALVIGARLNALVFLGHDAAHRIAFRNKLLNDVLGDVLVGWPLLGVINGGYRPWHLDHHRSLGTAADPELNYRGLFPYPGRVTWLKIGFFFALDLLGLGVPGLARVYKEVFPRRQPIRFLGPLLTWSIFVAVVIWCEAPWILFLWLYSFVGGYWAVFRVRTWTEHVEAQQAGKASSHRISAGPLARFLFLPHNTFCHYEHHKWPQVPYYNLPRVRELDASRNILPLIRLFPLV